MIMEKIFKGKNVVGDKWLIISHFGNEFLMQNSQYANVDQIGLQANSKLKKLVFFAQATIQLLMRLIVI